MRSYISTLFIFLMLMSIPTKNLSAQQATTYENTVKSANEKFEAKDYISAKTYYEMALRLKENDAFATKRLTETIQLIQKQLEQQEVFYQFLDQGDRLLKAGQTNDALTAYNKALEIFPQDKYVTKQVEQITASLQKEAESKKQFENHLQLAKNLLAEAKLDEALLQLNLALGIVPNDTELAKKLDETKKAIAQRDANEKSFQQLLADAENAVLRKNYTTAKEKLNDAIQLFPNDKTAQNKLAEATKLEQRQNLYNEQVALADAAYENKNMESALSLYQKAVGIWPEDAYASDMVSRINQLINSEEAILQKKLEQAFQKAELLFKANEFEAALEAYNEVVSLDAENNTALSRIVELTALIAQNNARRQAQKNFDLLVAKADALLDSDAQNALLNYQEAASIFPENEGVKEKIKQTEKIIQENTLKAKTAQDLNNFIAQADQEFADGKLTEAKINYEKALSIDSKATKPAQQIEVIQQMIQNQQLAAELELEFNNLMSNANAFIKENKLQPALDQIEKALLLQPNQSTALEQKANLEQKIRLKAQQMQLDEQYADALMQAEAAEKSGALQAALDLYNRALGLKPNEKIPAEKIVALQQQIDAQQALAKKDAEYNSLIQQADEQFESKSYAEAAQSYQQALAIKPTEKYPNDRLSETKTILNNLSVLAEQERNYNARIAEAEQLFSEEKYEPSIVKFKEASKIKPDETLPQTRIQLAEAKLAEANATKLKEEKINSLKIEVERLLTADQLIEAQEMLSEILTLDSQNTFATAKRAEITFTLEARQRENQARYDASMTEAEQLIAKKEYKQAVTSLKMALGFKPGDAAANQRLVQVEAIITEKLLALKTEYSKAVSEADRFYNSSSFDLAIEKYLLAEGIKPDETYPREMIKKIAAEMEANKIRELNQNLVLVPANTPKRFEFEPVDVTERRSNYIVIKAKNTGETAFPLLVRFGSKDERNGGFVLPIPENNELNDFIIKIGQQYKWFSEDNTWLEFLPENGTIEIGLIQITKSK